MSKVNKFSKTKVITLTPTMNAMIHVRANELHMYPGDLIRSILSEYFNQIPVHRDKVDKYMRQLG